MGYDLPERLGGTGRRPLRRNKFNARTKKDVRDLEARGGVMNDGPGFGGSRLEGAVYQGLLLLEKGGYISDIQQQVRVDLGYGISWKVDFSYYDEDKKVRVWVEAKGVRSARYLICLKLWEGNKVAPGRGPGRLEIWEGHYSSPRLTRIIKPREAA